MYLYFDTYRELKAAHDELANTVQDIKRVGYANGDERITFEDGTELCFRVRKVLVAGTQRCRCPQGCC